MLFSLENKHYPKKVGINPNGVTSSNVVNCPNIVNSSNVVNCPYKWAECSKLSNCCDKEKNKNKQKNTTLSEQFQNQLLVISRNNSILISL
jgi:hypothetical protein